jgi:hypothetical protein
MSRPEIACHFKSYQDESQSPEWFRNPYQGKNLHSLKYPPLTTSDVCAQYVHHLFEKLHNNSRA